MLLGISKSNLTCEVGCGLRFHARIMLGSFSDEDELCVLLFVVEAVFGEGQVLLCVAGAVFGEGQVLLFVAGAALGTLGRSH